MKTIDEKIDMYLEEINEDMSWMLMNAVVALGSVGVFLYYLYQTIKDYYYKDYKWYSSVKPSDVFHAWKSDSKVKAMLDRIKDSPELEDIKKQAVNPKTGNLYKEGSDKYRQTIAAIKKLVKPDEVSYLLKVIEKEVRQNKNAKNEDISEAMSETEKLKRLAERLRAQRKALGPAPQGDVVKHDQWTQKYVRLSDRIMDAENRFDMARDREAREKTGEKTNEAVVDSRFNPLRSQLRLAQKKADDAFREGVSKTLEAMDDYAENTCMKIYKDDPVNQKSCFATFCSRLIVFVQDTWQPYMSEELVNELVSEMDEHAKFIRKKYGWYGK